MEQEKEGRRARINRLKRMIILLATVAWIIPLLLCLILFGKMASGSKNLEEQTQLLKDILEKQDQIDARLDAVEKRISDLENGMPNTGEGTLDQMQSLAEDNNQEIILPKETDGQAKKRIYLTFDDGPSTYTGAILDVLKQYDIKATFFVNGKEGNWADEALKRIVEEGHTLGMHSYSHQYDEVYRSLEDFASDYERLHEHIMDVTGYDSRVYRFPGGSSNSISEIDMREFGRYLKERGTDYFDWNISSQDASGKLQPVEKLVRNCTKDLGKFDDCMILCHDAKSKSTTVEALPIIIEQILQMGDVEFLPITEGTPLIQHITIE